MILQSLGKTYVKSRGMIPFTQNLKTKKQTMSFSCLSAPLMICIVEKPINDIYLFFDR